MIVNHRTSIVNRPIRTAHPQSGENADAEHAKSEARPSPLPRPASLASCSQKYNLGASSVSPSRLAGVPQCKQQHKAQRLAEAEERLRLSRYASPDEKLRAQCAWLKLRLQVKNMRESTRIMVLTASLPFAQASDARSS